MPSLKIDIIIPIYFAPELSVRCIQSVFKNTSFDKHDIKVILIEDSESEENTSLVEYFLTKLNLQDKVVFFKNETNLGFIESCYKGIEFRESDYKLLLNSDTYVMPGWLDEMVATAESEERIAMVNPNTNKSSLIDVPMPEGFNINSMHSFFKNILPKEDDFIDLVTSTGFCLLIKSKYIKELGFLDRIYEKGYCEETDLYFRFVEKGLRAVLSRNAFVYHRGEASFTDRNERYERNLKILMKRYRRLHKKLLPAFRKTSVINKYRNIISEVKKIELDVVIITHSNSLENGENKLAHIVCNALNEEGMSATLACRNLDYNKLEDRFYAPINYSNLFKKDIQPKVVVYSSHYSINDVLDYAYFLYKTYHYFPKIVHLTQSFEQSPIANITMLVEPSIASELDETSRKNSNYKKLSNTVSLDFFSKKKKNAKTNIVVCSHMRSDDMIGNAVIIETLKHLDNMIQEKIKFVSFGDYKINYVFKNIQLEQKGPINEVSMVQLLQQANIFIEPNYSYELSAPSFEASNIGLDVIVNQFSNSVELYSKAPNVSFFQTGDHEELSKIILDKMASRKRNINQIDHSSVYDISSRKNAPLYKEFFSAALELPSFTESEFFRKVFNTKLLNSPKPVPPSYTPEKYKRQAYITTEKILYFMDNNKIIYNLCSRIFRISKKIFNKIR